MNGFATFVSDVQSTRERRSGQGVGRREYKEKTASSTQLQGAREGSYTTQVGRASRPGFLGLYVPEKKNLPK
jgi:hypothetical protein